MLLRCVYISITAIATSINMHIIQHNSVYARSKDSENFIIIMLASSHILLLCNV